MMASDTEDIMGDPHYRRASTARVDNEELMSRMKQLSSSFAIRAASNRRLLIDEHEDEDETALDGNICEFDLSKNVLDYLPNPVINQSIVSESEQNRMSVTDEAESRSRKTLLGNSKFLGVQCQSQSDRNLGATGGIKGLDMDPPFQSMFDPTEMRLLALVSHNNMKHAMKQFVIANKNVLKKFRLTGTNTTMTMLREVFGNDPEVVYGPACKSGPLGGDAQLVAMAVTSQLGGCIFFIDPMDAHPHSADIECLVRQGNVHNILMLNNPTTAHICLNTLRIALKMGRMEMFPSFFFDLESPSVEAYKMRQKQVLDSAIRNRNSITETFTRPLQESARILRPPSRDAQIVKAMTRANKISLQHRSSRKILSTSLTMDSKDIEDFLPGGPLENVPEKKEKVEVKARKKKFRFFQRSN